MSTSKEYKNFILEQLDLLYGITCRAMIGEYLLYYNGVLFGGIMVITSFGGYKCLKF